MPHEKIDPVPESESKQSKPSTTATTDEQLFDFYLDLSKNLRDDYFAETSRAAEIADVTQRTIQLWIESGFVRAVFIGGKFKVSLPSLR